MSFQPEVPQPQVPPAFQQPPPPVADAPKGKRRKGLIIFGLIVLVAGVLGGGAMVTKSTSNYEDAVKSMARAPVGCTTTLVFDKLGTFTLYVETKGKLSDLRGDCDANDSEYEHSGDRLPRLSLTLTDSGGDEVDLQRGASGSYDAGGFKGEAYRTVKIEDAGTYRLSVESDDTDFAVSIGKNPKEDSDLLKTIGGAVALAGVVLGLMFLLLGLRRRRPGVPQVSTGMPVGPTGPWTPASFPAAPPAPPMHPGYRPEPPAVPEQPPMRLPEQPPGGFAPPSVTPPPPPHADTPPPPPGWSAPHEPDED